MVVDQVQAASVTKSSGLAANPYDNAFGPSKLVADPFVASFAAPQQGMLFAGLGALSLDATNVTASGTTSGLSALYGTGYGAEFDNGLYLDPRLNLNEAAFRSAMSGADTNIRLAQTDGGFWRGLAGDTRNVFETPAPLSEKIGSGVRAVGAFIADPLIELGNQYRDVFSAANGATGGWRSALAQQVSDGSYGGAALTELGMVAGTAPMAGAALKGLAWAAPAAGPMIDTYAARSGMVLNVVEAGPSGVNRAGLVDLSTSDLAPGFYRADPAQIRFTQSDASPFFSKGGTIDSLVSDLRSGKVTADQVGNPLQVVMHEGLPFSIDNRRLVAFNLAGVRDVPIQIVTLDNPAVAARFFDRFDPIGGVGKNIVIAPSSARTPAQMLLRDSGLIKGVQLGY